MPSTPSPRIAATAPPAAPAVTATAKSAPFVCYGGQVPAIYGAGEHRSEEDELTGRVDEREGVVVGKKVRVQARCWPERVRSGESSLLDEQYAVTQVNQPGSRSALSSHSRAARSFSTAAV